MKDTLKKAVTSILIAESKVIIKKYSPKVVTVTGSVGKTSTKDAIYSVLSSSEYTRKSEKSFNSEIGVPLTILGLPNAWSSFFGWIENIAEGFWAILKKETYPKWLVLEIGVDRPGDIAKLSWLKSNVVVFTYFPDIPVHVEYFSTPDDVIKEKRELKKTLLPEGTLICNADDPKMQDEKVLEGQHVLTYGYSKSAHVRGFDYEVTYEEGRPKGIAFSVQFQDKMVRHTYDGVLGAHHAYPLLAGVAVGVSEGKVFEQLFEGLSRHEPAPGRMRILRGKKNTAIIDDTYNSSPAAVKAGLKALQDLQVHGKKIVVLGDMLELGDYSVREHEEIGKIASTVGDVFITIGVRMNDAGGVAEKEKGKCKRVETCTSKEDALAILDEILEEGDCIFIKGSQGMRMERLTEKLLEDASRDSNLLPRQDSHWKSIA